MFIRFSWPSIVVHRLCLCVCLAGHVDNWVLSHQGSPQLPKFNGLHSANCSSWSESGNTFVWNIRSAYTCLHTLCTTVLIRRFMLLSANNILQQLRMYIFSISLYLLQLRTTSYPTCIYSMLFKGVQNPYKNVTYSSHVFCMLHTCNCQLW